MGDHSHPGIAVYRLHVSQGTPVCYNKMLDVCIVTESKDMSNYNNYKKTHKNTEKKEKRTTLPRITHQLRDISILV